MTDVLHPAVRAAARTLAQWYGIEVPDYRMPLLASEMTHLGGRHGVEVALERLLARDTAAWDAVIDAMTVPETYLFRHFGHFVLLRELAEKRHQQGRSMRVLSAGCSSGEEAWSAAAVLADATPSRTARDQVVGWDVNERRLQRAREARYRDWSARAGLHGHDAYFTRDGAYWEVAPHLRSLVDFERVNLVGDLPYRNSPFDAIFFRNVGIYWDHATAQSVVRALARLLADDGLFLIGPSDPGLHQPELWEHVIQGGVRHYRRHTESPEAPTPRAPKPKPRAPAPPRRTRSRTVVRPRSRPAARMTGAMLRAGAVPHRPPRPPASPATPPCRDPIPATSAPTLDDVRALADAGEHALALNLLDRTPPPHDVEARLWRGILLLALEQASAAVQAFKQCVYLEPNLPSHRRWLAVAYERAGRAGDAEREIRNAAELVAP